MKQYTVKLTSEELRTLCIKNGWFSAGTGEQYEKLFQANQAGATAETLATIIWTCSAGSELAEIHAELERAAAWPIYLESVAQALMAAEFGPTEIEIVLEAIRSNPAAGTCYRSIEESET